MSEDSDRPLVTFALFAYNQRRFVRAAVEGALRQTYSPLEIILSDDCSTDGTFELMQQIASEYTGPHEVRLNRNEVNAGIPRHINAVVGMARGRLIVAAAGDDISLPDRTASLVALWNQGQQAHDMLCSDYLEISEDGALRLDAIRRPRPDLSSRAVAHHGHGVLGATAAWSPRLWEVFGPLPEGSVAEDNILSFRAALLGGIGYAPEPLVRYRVGVSTWIGRGPADHHEIRRRNRVSVRNVVVIAQTAARDAEAVGRVDLLPIIQRRLNEAELVDQIFSGARPSAAAIARLVRGGGRVDRLAKAYIQCRFPALHAMVRAARAARESLHS